LKTGEITFENRAEVLENAYSRLKEMKYFDKGIEKEIKYINERKLDLQSETIKFLTWFLNEEISLEGIIKSAALEAEFPVYKQQDKFISFGEQDFENIKAGQTGEKYKINTQDGIITNYSTLKVDSVKSRFERVVDGRYFGNWNLTFALSILNKFPQINCLLTVK